jgi:hypothetical protein
MTSFVQEQFRGTSEFGRVGALANALLDHLRTPEAAARIAAANVPGVASQKIQEVFVAFARELGFVDERVGLFKSYESAVRPDYFLPLGDTGILLEVERGKTTINNMDFLDFWKCHLCEHAHYLFLLVPRELRPNAKMAARREYAAVVRRLETFFRPRNYTNVRGLSSDHRSVLDRAHSNRRRYDRMDDQARDPGIASRPAGSGAVAARPSGLARDRGRALDFEPAVGAALVRRERRRVRALHGLARGASSPAEARRR